MVVMANVMATLSGMLVDDEIGGAGLGEHFSRIVVGAEKLSDVNIPCANAGSSLYTNPVKRSPRPAPSPSVWRWCSDGWLVGWLVGEKLDGMAANDGVGID